jgi:hypothetical protein
MFINFYDFPLQNAANARMQEPNNQLVVNNQNNQPDAS